MTDMNKSIGDTPIHKPVQTSFSKKEAEPAFGCADCVEEAAATPETNLKFDPRDAQGRSLVAKRQISELKEMDPKIREGVEGALENLELLEPFREELIERGLSTGKFTREQMEEAVDLILLNVFSEQN